MNVAGNTAEGAATPLALSPAKLRVITLDLVAEAFADAGRTFRS